jgi:hypothetical protein
MNPPPPTSRSRIRRIRRDSDRHRGADVGLHRRRIRDERGLESNERIPDGQQLR